MVVAINWVGDCRLPLQRLSGKLLDTPIPKSDIAHLVVNLIGPTNGRANLRSGGGTGDPKSRPDTRQGTASLTIDYAIYIAIARKHGLWLGLTPFERDKVRNVSVVKSRPAASNGRAREYPVPSQRTLLARRGGPFWLSVSQEVLAWHKELKTK